MSLLEKSYVIKINSKLTLLDSLIVYSSWGTSRN